MHLQKVAEISKLTKVSQLPRKAKKHESRALAPLNEKSFSVSKGDMLGTLGPNGEGNTTTLEMIEGLKQ